jgi:hypothetical protein
LLPLASAASVSDIESEQYSVPYTCPVRAGIC